MNTPTKKVLQEFDKKFPFVETELGEDHPNIKISDIRRFLEKKIWK